MRKPVLLLGVIILMAGVYYFLSKTPKVYKKETLEIVKEKPLKKSMKKKEAAEIKIVIIYDNNLYDSRLKAGWGFSSLVKTGEKKVLFDTGADSSTLLSNMEKLGISPKEIDVVVLSHIHGDHVGGLWGVLERNPDVEVFLPVSFPKDFKDKVRSYGAKVIEVSDSVKIADGIYSTGELGIWIREQSLIVKTDKGLVIITGCAHPGIVNIVKRTKELFDERVYLVLGGFHLGGVSDEELLSIIKEFKELGVKKATPCHCSGDRCRELFKKEYADDFIEVGVGKAITISL